MVKRNMYTSLKYYKKNKKMENNTENKNKIKFWMQKLKKCQGFRS